MAHAPAACTVVGFRYAPCPPLGTEEEQRALVGRRTLTAHILKGTVAWYVGTVQAFGVGARMKKEQSAPDATHVLIFAKKDGVPNALVGRVPAQLSASNYGANEWWLLLDPV